MALPPHRRFLGIALYGSLHGQLILIFRTYSSKYDQQSGVLLTIPPTRGSGIIITVSNELQPNFPYKALPIFEVTDYVDALLATLHRN